MFKKITALGIFIVLAGTLVACGKNDEKINVVTREQGSGTRAAFTEITGILEKNNDKEIDNTYKEAIVQNSTDGVMKTVIGDKNAIGYISLGSLNDTVKALDVNGVSANAENIKNGTYEISRNFILVNKENSSDGVKDFIKFIESDQGQKIVSEEGYIDAPQGLEYVGTNNSENITIAGSTSVAPLMEKLVEGYKKFNPSFRADIQATGSSAGIKAVQDNSAQIGMSSRELKSSEENLDKSIIAMDGIVVIVNKDFEKNDLTLDNIKDIFTGKKTNWVDL